LGVLDFKIVGGLMAIVFMDGFERASLSQWVINDTAGTTAGIAGLGGYCCNMRLAGYIYAPLPTPVSLLYLTVKIRIQVAQAVLILFADSTGTSIFSLRQNASTGCIDLCLGNGGATVAAGSQAISLNTTYLIEVYYRPLNSGGECTVKIDGIADATYTGDTTAGLENISRVYFLSVNSASCYYFDDVAVSDSDWLGNVYIQAIYPTGAGTTTSWDPSTGSNYDCVNEVPASDTDYVSTNVTNEVDTYACNNLTGAIGSVLAVNVFARTAYEGSVTPTRIQIVVRNNSVDYPSGETIHPALSFTTSSYLWEQDPDSDDAWTETEINGLEIGVKAVA
jgi:hypothetical protein